MFEVGWHGIAGRFLPKKRLNFNDEENNMPITQSEQWHKIYTLTKEFSEWFPDGMVLIGGIAVYLHTKETLKDFIEYSHDSVFCLSLMDLSDLREFEEITHNKRLGKHQIIKQGVEFDVYIEHQNNLIIPFTELSNASVVKEGVRCASLSHLLILKMKALDDREGSAKGDKDLRDLAKIVICIDETTQENKDILLLYLTDKWIKRLQNMASSPVVFQDITSGDPHVSKKLKTAFSQKINAIVEYKNATDFTSSEHSNRNLSSPRP